MKREMDRRILLAIWLANAVAVALSYLWNMSWVLPLILLAVIGEWVYCLLPLRWNKERVEKGHKIPPWVWCVVLASVIYTGINFILCMILLGDGMPHVEDGVYCLWNHGFIRAISEEEYTRLKMIEGRLFLGHLLTFSGLSMLFLSNRGRDGRKGGER